MVKAKKTWDVLKHLLSGNTRHPLLSTFYDSDGQPWVFQLKLQMRLIFISLVLDVISLEKLLHVVDTIVNIS